jgi:hypothetical protein
VLTIAIFGPPRAIPAMQKREDMMSSLSWKLLLELAAQSVQAAGQTGLTQLAESAGQRIVLAASLSILTTLTNQLLCGRESLLHQLLVLLADLRGGLALLLTILTLLGLGLLLSLLNLLSGANDHLGVALELLVLLTTLLALLLLAGRNDRLSCLGQRILLLAAGRAAATVRRSAAGVGGVGSLVGGLIGSRIGSLVGLVMVVALVGAVGGRRVAGALDAVYDARRTLVVIGGVGFAVDLGAVLRSLCALSGGTLLAGVVGGGLGWG